MIDETKNTESSGTPESSGKKGFFRRVFNRKSKEEKRAEAAAEKALSDGCVEEDMAERMAEITAEALRSADVQDILQGTTPPTVTEPELERVTPERVEPQTASLPKTSTPNTVPPSANIDPHALSQQDRFFGRIARGLKKSTSRMSDNMSSLFTKRKLDAAAIEDLQDLLIAADFGVGPALMVTERLSKDRFDKQISDMDIKIALSEVIADILTPLEAPLVLNDAKLQILLFVGVNGSGKTTTLGKLAKRYTDQGQKVLLAAGDTFRAAAVQQLTVWGERAGAPVVSGKLGADAAGLIYEAVARAKEESFDILMIDTAGRLQNRTELMDELSKIVRVIQKHDETAPHHCILVLDATVGQNALSQTEAFQRRAGVTGLIMTKLDGTAKGGVLVALSDKYKLPIHAIGIGEQVEDLETFSAPVFAAALSGVANAVIESP